MPLKVLFMLGIVGFLSLRARKEPFIPLCALIGLVGLMENREWIPRGMANVPGLNPWNLLFLVVTFFWAVNRSRSASPLPPVTRWFWVYCIAVTVTTLRLFIDPTHWFDHGYGQLSMDYILNGVKFVLPAVILFDLCDTRKRAAIATLAIIGSFLLLGVQIINYMGLSELSGSQLNHRSIRIISRDTGYHRVDAAMMMAGASWGAFALTEFFRTTRQRYSFMAASVILLLALILTGGRAGYLAWCCTGLFLAVIRWRKLLILAPFGLIAVLAFMPGALDRFTTGFGSNEGPIVVAQDQNEMTSGRVEIWPHVIEKIKDHPIIGHGREGMKRSGLSDFARSVLGEPWGQPHNAYFEVLLDNGIVGLLTILPIYLIAAFISFRLFVSNNDPLKIAIGGLCLALLTAHFVASVGSQTFYPRQGMVGIFCAMALVIRVRYFSLEDSEELPEGKVAPPNFSTLFTRPF